MYVFVRMRTSKHTTNQKIPMNTQTLTLSALTLAIAASFSLQVNAQDKAKEADEASIEKVEIVAKRRGKYHHRCLEVTAC